MIKRGLCFCVGILPRGIGRAVPKMRMSQCAFTPKLSPEFALFRKIYHRDMSEVLPNHLRRSPIIHGSLTQ